MPPIPPGGIAGPFSFSGTSVTNASVVSNRPAIDAAFCSARLFLFHLGLGGCADIDDGNTAREFRESLLQFLFVVIAGRLFNLTTDLSDTSLDIGALA